MVLYRLNGLFYTFGNDSMLLVIFGTIIYFKGLLNGIDLTIPTY